MKHYFSPGACSLADHIALHEANIEFDRVRVDLKSKRTEDGQDYGQVNPKGYVPALVLDGGEVLTENIAILDWIAHQKPELKPSGELGHTRLLECLAFISTEIHKSFKPYFAGGTEEEKAKVAQVLQKRFGEVASMMQGNYLFGADLSVADAYLFVMTMWAGKMGVPLPEALDRFRERMMQRDAVMLALQHEGLEPPQ